MQQLQLSLKSSAKVPIFWKPDSKIWFLQLEAQFRNAKIIVDQTKYHYLISSIGPDILSQVSDILLRPPQNGKYQAVKDITFVIYRLRDNPPKITE